ncbi:unnamed protein product, partial [Iphiclides podalirius]
MLGAQNRAVDCEMDYATYAKNDFLKLVPIAPAPGRKYVSGLEEVDAYARYNYKGAGVGAQAASIARRNARERNRVKQVNDGFNALRKRLPAAVVAALSGGARRGSGKKLSKVDTLRMVVEYIKYLQGLIDDGDAASVVDTAKSPPAYEDEGVVGDSSPYSESVPSPVTSECSSGVSSEYSPGDCYTSCCINEDLIYPSEELATRMDDTELLDAIAWWQQK